MNRIYCTFYRPEKVNTREFENIIGKLAYDLHLLETEQYDEYCIYSYFRDLCCYAQPSEKNPAMSFFGLANPRSMPSDSRVVYFYHPSYIATAWMIKAVLLYPSLMTEATFLSSGRDFTAETVRNTLAACLLGCTGRGFDGAGQLPLKDCIKIFENAGADEFIAQYPDLCSEFTKLYQEAKAFVESGQIDAREAWYRHGH